MKRFKRPYKLVNLVRELERFFFLSKISRTHSVKKSVMMRWTCLIQSEGQETVDDSYISEFFLLLEKYLIFEKWTFVDVFYLAVFFLGWLHKFGISGCLEIVLRFVRVWDVLPLVLTGQLLFDLWYSCQCIHDYKNQALCQCYCRLVQPASWISPWTSPCNRSGFETSVHFFVKTCFFFHENTIFLVIGNSHFICPFCMIKRC